MSQTQTCPYCAEEIRAEAVFCRFCRSRLAGVEGVEWYRSHPDARLAGVCAALAHALQLPVGLVRLTFVVFTLFVHIGLFAYVGLWLLIPPAPGETSHAETMLEKALALLRGAAGPAGGPRRDPSDSWE